jgi:asparagine synthase (glutamine-hydrolysing)
VSGLCGFFGPGGTAPPLATLRRMARPLSQFDQAPPQTMVHGRAALAVAACHGSAHVWQRDGLLVAIWGRPEIAGTRTDVARAFAELWEQLGTQACERLSGAFALCVIDSAQDQVLLALDRSGSHTLTFQQCTGGLLFASSADALLAHPQASRELDPQALYDYLYFHMIPAPRTIYRSQQRLLPGEYLLYRSGRSERGQYWTPRFREDAGQSVDDLKTEFLAAVDQAVRREADGPAVGAFLSGGTDSSTIAGMLCRINDSPARTYSIGFDVDGYDEMDYARIAARHFGAVHHEMYVNANDVADAIPRIAAAFDQPYGNASAVPAYYCASMARADGITRLLGGDGGDELFGGNERYARQAVFSRYEKIPSALRQVLLEPVLFGLAGKRQQALLRKARSYVTQALVPMPARLETYNLLQRYGQAAVFEPGFLSQVDGGGPLAQLNERYWHTRGLSQINRMQALDLQYTLADNDLRKVSTACQLAGVEAAFPFLSDELMAFSARLAPRHKLRGTQLRHFFKQALSDTLPRAILRKKKHGFGLPVGHWLHSHARLRAMAYDSLGDLKTRGIVRPAFIEDLMQNQLQQHPAYHGTMVWVLMMLEHWFRQHGAADRSLEEVHDGYEIRQG